MIFNNIRDTRNMKAYIIFPVFAIFLIATAFNDDFLSTIYTVKMGLALLFLIITVILLIKDINRKKQQ